MLAMPIELPPEKDRRSIFAASFWGKVEKSEGCWLWRGPIDRYGYGKVSVLGRTRKAHRVAWALAGWTADADGALILHRCDVRACVNPEHLYPGTSRDNNHDTISRSSSRVGGAPGERNPCARLTWSDVREIRRLASDGTSRASLAERFGVSCGTVHNIVSGRKWKQAARS